MALFGGGADGSCLNTPEGQAQLAESSLNRLESARCPSPCLHSARVGNAGRAACLIKTHRDPMRPARNRRRPVWDHQASNTCGTRATYGRRCRRRPPGSTPLRPPVRSQRSGHCEAFASIGPVVARGHASTGVWPGPRQLHEIHSVSTPGVFRPLDRPGRCYGRHRAEQRR